eukprot:TRINITY_DN882_c0_g1_i2.p2 TRINITY_DN882_c0_g1~~TRINITY_DN882_c0_g1_i2.p2  ORF type:complete len:282 (-),score=54.95 TRINITY_DN882_c0_g1_i2:265-1083(-)
MGITDLYQVVGVAREATVEEIKKAYKKQALRLHPDKNQDDEEAKEKFQMLQRAYVILSDPQKREVYDETGDLQDAEEMGDKDFADICPTITVEDIQQFQDSYRGSEEEASDLLELYRQFKGDMDVVFGFQICAYEGLDDHRFMDIICQAIDKGEVKSYKKFQSWSTQVKTKPAPKDPLEQAKKRATGLIQAIQQTKTKQQKQFDSMVSMLEQKYCAPKGKQRNGQRNGKTQKRKLQEYEEPTEEEFLAARERMENRKNTQKETKRKRGRQTK